MLWSQCSWICYDWGLHCFTRIKKIFNIKQDTCWFYNKVKKPVQPTNGQLFTLVNAQKTTDYLLNNNNTSLMFQGQFLIFNKNTVGTCLKLV